MIAGYQDIPKQMLSSFSKASEDFLKAKAKKKLKIISLLLVNSPTTRKWNIKGWLRLIFIVFEGFLLRQSFESFLACLKMKKINE